MLFQDVAEGKSVTPDIKIQLQRDLGEGSSRSYLYHLAGRTIALDTEFDELEAYQEVGFYGSMQPFVLDSDRGHSQLTYDGPGWLGHAWRTVSCWAYPHGYRIDISGAGQFVVRNHGREIACLVLDPQCSSSLLVESVFGPAFILALALQDTWCIHASAVEVNGKAVLFAGESGFGKSTLAKYLSSTSRFRYQYLADDVLPVVLTRRGLIGLPRYPQLKLAADAQPGPRFARRIPVAALFSLQGHFEDGICTEATSAQAATLTVIQNTVAVRLVDKDSLVRHLDFCSQVVSSVPIFSLGYPHEVDVLPQVRKAITEILEELGVID